MKKAYLFLCVLLVGGFFGCKAYLPDTSTVTITNDKSKGTVTVDKLNPVVGDFITITVIPKEGYSVWYVTANGYSIDRSDDQSDGGLKWYYVVKQGKTEISVNYSTAYQHTISYSPALHGSFEISTETRNNVQSGDKLYEDSIVTVKVFPDVNYHLKKDGLIVKEAFSHDVPVSQDETDKNKFTFTVPKYDFSLKVIFQSDIYFEPVVSSVVKGEKLTFNVVNLTNTTNYDVYLNNELYKSGETLINGAKYELDTSSMLEGYIELKGKDASGFEFDGTEGLVKYDPADIPAGFTEIGLKINSITSNEKNSVVKSVVFERVNTNYYGSLVYKYYYESNPNDVKTRSGYLYYDGLTDPVSNLVLYDTPSDSLIIWVYYTSYYDKLISGKCKIDLTECTTITESKKDTLQASYLGVIECNDDYIEWDVSSDKDIYFECEASNSTTYKFTSKKPTAIPRKVYFKESSTGDRKAFAKLTVDYSGSFTKEYQAKILLYYINEGTKIMKAKPDASSYTFSAKTKNAYYISLDDATVIITDPDDRNDVKATFTNVNVDSGDIKIKPDYTTFTPVAGDEYKIWLEYEGIISDPITLIINE